MILAEQTKKISEADIITMRKDFPILNEEAYGKPLIYFDNAATSQKPKMVIDALNNYYSTYNANVHRGVHFLSQKASQAFDDVRIKVKQFINATSEKEIVFTKGTTDSINLVASTYGKKNIGKGDEVIISEMEHHSNIVPWQMLCDEQQAILKVIPMNDSGELMMDEYEKLFSSRTKLVAIVHTSNSLGTINHVKEIIAIAHRYKVPVLVDGAQVVAHTNIDVLDLDCDFLAFSGHKMYGPMGTGVLYGKLNLLEDMPPYQGGGEMIQSVSFEKTTYNEVPYKFEAGTPNVADMIGLGAAIDYISALDREAILNYEMDLMHYASARLMEIDGVQLIGTAKEKTSVVSFIINGVNALDAGMYLDTKGIAVRTGHHCTEPVMKRLNIPGTIRASFLFYNTKTEIDAMIEGVKGAIKLLRK